jgi:carboxyl-terminal processing protease
MQVTDRNGASELVNVRWRKPVAMLVKSGTRSGKEVLACGFKKNRLGEVIGSRTEEAVLASTAFLIGGGLLLLAVEDVQVGGERLEGVGVAPMIEVQTDRPPRVQVILSLSVQSRSCPWLDTCHAPFPASYTDPENRWDG